MSMHTREVLFYARAHGDAHISCISTSFMIGSKSKAEDRTYIIE